MNVPTFNISLFLLIACLMAAVPVHAQQEPDTAKAAQVTIDNADLSTFIRKESRYVGYYYGNVKMRQDSVYFRADTAIKDGNDFTAWDNVSIQQGDSLSLFSDSLNHQGDSLRAYLYNNVALVDGNTQLFTDYLIYLMDQKVGFYDAGGLLVREDARLISKKGRYNTRTDQMLFYDSVRVAHPDFLLKTDSLLYYTEENRVHFLGPTLITFDEERIYCERGYYDIDRQYAFLYRNAQRTRGDEQTRADTMIYEGSKKKTILLGSAEFRDTIRRASADTIIYWSELDETHLLGNANFRDQNTEAAGAQLIYLHNSEEVIAERRAKYLVGEGQTLEADISRFDNTSGAGIARGAVVWSDSLERRLLYAERLNFAKKDDRVRTGGGRPLFASYNEEGDTLLISADSIHSYSKHLAAEDSAGVREETTFQEAEIALDTSLLQDSVAVQDSAYGQDAAPVLDTAAMPDAEPLADSTAGSDSLQGGDSTRIMKARGQVIIWSEDMSGVCDSLIYNSHDSLIRMYGTPILWADSAQISGDSIWLWVVEGKIRNMEVFGNALMVHWVQGTYFNQVQSIDMEAVFRSGKIADVTARRNAESYYYILDDDDAFIGLKKAAASRIKASFDTLSELSSIVYYRQIDGVVLPMEGLSPEKERFERFFWAWDRKPKSKADLKYAVSLQLIVDRTLSWSSPEPELERPSSETEKDEVESEEEKLMREGWNPVPSEEEGHTDPGG